MIINHKRKFVFVCVPKTGSTTLSKHFLRIDDLFYDKSWLMKKWHWPMQGIYERYPNQPLQSYYKFAYHRNPWDRMISSWIEFTEEKGHLATWSQPMKDAFKDFEDFIINFRNTEWAEDIHFRPTTWYTHHEGKQIVDHIAMYSKWQEETQKIFNRLDLKIEDLESKRWRQTKRDKDYKRYYTSDKMIEEVAQHFSMDIHLFGDTY